MGSLVPQHDREENAYVVPVKVVHHLLDGAKSTGKIPEEIVLAPAVNADIRISVPYEHAIDAAIALIHVVQIAIDSVLAG